MAAGFHPQLNATAPFGAQAFDILLLVSGMSPHPAVFIYTLKLLEFALVFGGEKVQN